MLNSEYPKVIYTIRHDDLLNDLYHLANDENDIICEKLYSIFKKLTSEETYQKLRKLSDEYEFFNNLHIQSEYDNIISLIKCSERLGVNIESNINIQEPNYDKIWIEIINKIDDNNIINTLNEVRKACVIQYEYFLNNIRKDKTLLKVQCLERHLNEDYQFIDIRNLLEEFYFEDYVNFIHSYNERFDFEINSSCNNKNREPAGLGALFG